MKKTSFLTIILTASIVAVITVLLLRLFDIQQTTTIAGGVAGGIVGAIMGLKIKKK